MKIGCTDMHIIPFVSNLECLSTFHSIQTSYYHYLVFNALLLSLHLWVAQKPSNHGINFYPFTLASCFLDIFSKEPMKEVMSTFLKQNFCVFKSDHEAVYFAADVANDI